MVNAIVKRTNEEGRRQKGERWQDMDTMEIDRFIGVLLMLGAQKHNIVSSQVIWAPLEGQDCVRATMSRM